MIVLKIIVMIIVFIAALAALAAGLFLFVPVRYELTAQKSAIGEKSSITFKLSWFLGFFRLVFDGKKLKATIFWFKQPGGKNKRSPKSKNTSRSRSHKEQDKGQKKDDNKQAGESSISENKDKTMSKKIFSVIKAFFAYPDKKLLWQYTRVLLLRTLKALKPRKLSAILEIGADDPSQTGILLGIAGIIQGIWGMDIEANGNFDERALSYKLYVCDAVMLWSLTWPLLAYCFKRPVRKLIIKYFFKKDDVNEPVVKSKP